MEILSRQAHISQQNPAKIVQVRSVSTVHVQCYVHVHVCVCMCVCVHVYVHLCVCVCVCVLFGLLKRERGGKRGEKGKVRGSGGVCRRHQRTANQASMHALSDYCRSVPIQEL